MTATKKRRPSTTRRATRPAAGAVAEPPPPAYEHLPATARVFQSGNSQAVRLPKQFRLRSKEVYVFRRGHDIVLREKTAKLGQLLAALPPLPENALPDEIPDRAPEPLEKL